MASFRFLHSADIHLDSPLKGLTRQEGNPVERIRTATRLALECLVETAIEEQVDFIIIAGDLYDGDWRDYNTGLFFIKQMGRLNESNVPVYLLYGNHDAESGITKKLELPKNVSVFSSKEPQTFEIKTVDVALHGQSFCRRDVTDNLVPSYPAPLNGIFNIGVLHTGLGGRGGHDNYAPCKLNDLVNKGYDYWALGHVHKREVLHERPHVVFPGNLQGRHIKEKGAKGAYLVTVEDSEVIELKFSPCDDVRWEGLHVSLNHTDDMGSVRDRIRDELETAVAEKAEGRLLACRLVIRGCTELHTQLVAGEEQLLADAHACALGLGNEVVWVEKIVLDTPTPSTQRLFQREDAIGDLLQLLREAASDEILLRRLKDSVGTLVQRLPHEVRSATDARLIKLAAEEKYDDLITVATLYLLARLTAEDG